MRFSFATVLLAASVFAAPVQNVDKRESLSLTNALSLLRRVPVFAPPPALKPASRPAPGGPKPDSAPPRPNSPNERPEGPGRLGPEAPAAKPKPAGGCGLKRGTKCNPGADPKYEIDEKYQRDMEVKAKPPSGAYLQEAGLVGGGDGKKWTSIDTRNNEEIEQRMEQRWVDFLVLEKEYKKHDAVHEVWDWLPLLTDENNSRRNFVSTSHKFEKGNGVLVVRSSYNREYDFYRQYEWKTDDGVDHVRPAINDGNDAVSWTDHVMDNMRVAASQSEGTSVKDLRHIARDNIETEGVQNLMKELLDGKPGKKTFTVADNPSEIARLGETLHGATTSSLLRKHAGELGKLEIQQYTLWWKDDRFDMLIDVAPPPSRRKRPT